MRARAARFWQYVGGAVPEDELTPAEYQAFARVHTYTRGKRAGEVEKTGAAFKEGQRFHRFSKVPRSA